MARGVANRVRWEIYSVVRVWLVVQAALYAEKVDSRGMQGTDFGRGGGGGGGGRGKIAPPPYLTPEPLETLL